MKMWYNMFINKLNNMIHHIVYRTTDVTTGEYYIGFHSYDDQDPPSYFGTYKRETHWEPDEDNLIRETLMEFSSRDEAREAEPGFIGPHLGHPLCMNLHANMMSKDFDQYGKPGTRLGKTHTEESRQKMRENHSGEGNPMWGKPGPWLGKNLYPETREKLRQAQLGKKLSSETREKISKGGKGRIVTQETRNKQRESAKNRPKIECPYCGGLYDIMNAKRWHFDNCKKLK